MNYEGIVTLAGLHFTKQDLLTLKKTMKMEKYGRKWERLNWESSIETNPREWWYAFKIGNDVIMEENVTGLFILIDANGLIWASNF